MCLMAVGYNRFRNQEDFKPIFRENIRVLAEKSLFLGLRNHGSIEAVRKYLPDELHSKLRFQPCLTTVISKLYPQFFTRRLDGRFLSLNCTFDRSELRYGDRKQKILQSITKSVSTLASQFDLRVKYYSHFKADEEMISVLRSDDLEFYVVDLSILDSRGIIDAYSKPTLALGMRGHAQMIPFGCRTPILSLISHNKLQWFLDDIEQPGWGIDVHQSDLESQIVGCASRILEDRRCRRHNQDDTVRTVEGLQSQY